MAYRLNRGLVPVRGRRPARGTTDRVRAAAADIVAVRRLLRRLNEGLREEGPEPAPGFGTLLYPGRYAVGAAVLERVTVWTVSARRWWAITDLGAMCGNGLRLLVDTGLHRSGAFLIATRAGTRRVYVPSDHTGSSPPAAPTTSSCASTNESSARPAPAAPEPASPSPPPAPTSRTRPSLSTTPPTCPAAASTSRYAPTAP